VTAFDGTASYLVHVPSANSCFRLPKMRPKRQFNAWLSAMRKYDVITRRTLGAHRARNPLALVQQDLPYAFSA